ncbi:MAG: carboxymuconolactone decarboxylase family protein [Balneolales bacterium]|nr:carboxymuconolactone decarboxylase family protein [Balneolales bacterium]
MKKIKTRISINDLEPGAYKAMFGLEKYINSTDLNPVWRELIKIRASQINGCAFCIEMHTKEAREAGETERRIYALNAWKESPLFTDEERTLLAMTEEITLIADSGLKERTYLKALELFDENSVAQIIMLIVTINAWNRIAVSTHMMHQVDE